MSGIEVEDIHLGTRKIPRYKVQSLARGTPRNREQDDVHTLNTSDGTYYIKGSYTILCAKFF